MYRNLIISQLDSLINAGLVDASKRDEGIDVMMAWWKNRMAIVWDIEDVRSQADGMGIELTDEQCREVLYQVLKYNDAEVGVSWRTIEYYIRDLVASGRADAYLNGGKP